MLNLSEGLLREAKTYPALCPQDVIKYVYQYTFGGGHLVKDAASSFLHLRGEYTAAKADGRRHMPSTPEPLGNGLCRWPILFEPEDARGKSDRQLAEQAYLSALNRAFVWGSAHWQSRETEAEQTERKTSADAFREGMNEAYALLRAHAGDGVFPFTEEELRSAFEANYPALGDTVCGFSAGGSSAAAGAGAPYYALVSHSSAFRKAYAPCYRLLPENAARYLHALKLIEEKLLAQGFAIVAIDGLCGSGKTSFAAFLQEVYGCGVIHMDDFFLPVALRTAERRAEPGGNVHYERFMEEVVKPLLQKKEIWQRSDHPGEAAETLKYRRFDCRSMDFQEEKLETPLTRVLVIEGSYSMRPEFCPLYDLKLFLCCSRAEQKARIIRRNGEVHYQDFQNLWIPLENAYFDGLAVEARADLAVRTDAEVGPGLFSMREN